MSETPADAPRLSPSPVKTSFAGAWSMPESASSGVQWIVTSPLYHPLSFGAVVAAPDSVGSVRSMSTSDTVAVAVLPALSTAVPVLLWPAPSCVKS